MKGNQEGCAYVKGRVDKCGFMVALGSGWVSHWGLTG